jgi:hypothetical protein
MEVVVVHTCLQPLCVDFPIFGAITFSFWIIPMVSASKWMYLTVATRFFWLERLQEANVKQKLLYADRDCQVCLFMRGVRVVWMWVCHSTEHLHVVC